MSFHQLSPELPVDTPYGSGRAIAVIDYSPSDDLLWVCVIDDTGEVWTINNRDIRVTKNITLGRRVERVEERVPKTVRVCTSCGMVEEKGVPLGSYALSCLPRPGREHTWGPWGQWQ
jgi:hypothetical protein